MASKDVMGNFFNQVENKRKKQVEWYDGNISCQVCGGISKLYSYGLCIAFKTKDGKFLLNGTKNSVTTNKHISWMVSAAGIHADGNYGIVSFQAMERALGWGWMDKVEVLDSQKDEHYYLAKIDGVMYHSYNYLLYAAQASENYFKDQWMNDLEQNKKFDTNSHINGAIMDFKTLRKKEDGYSHDIASCRYHKAGGVLLKAGDRLFAGVLDEMQWCLIEIEDTSLSSIEDALKSLEPAEVQKAKEDGLAVPRQGEWFFIPTTYTDQDLVEMFHVGKLKDILDKDMCLSGNYNSNLHCPTEMILPLEYNLGWNRPADWLDDARSNTLDIRGFHGVDRAIDMANDMIGKYRIFVRGKVSHRSKKFGWETNADTPLRLSKWTSLSGEHKTLDLGKDVWYEAFKNTEKQSWTQSGKFD